MAVVRRYDAGQLKKPEKMPNGWLKVDGLLTRTGIFLYRNADGTTRRELRLPEEVFKADSVKTFGLTPVTDDHPPKMLDATNTAQYQRGTVDGNVTAEGEFLRASMLITDERLIRKMDGGKVQLSCGYTCELEFKPGEYNGEKYDAIQRNISGNHVAIVDVGRAGPGASVRMDNADAVMVVSDSHSEGSPSTEVPAMKRKIKIDGVEFEVEETTAQAFDQFIARNDAKIATLASDRTAAIAERDREKARADSATAELATEKQARADAASPEKIRTLIAARVALEGAARGVLGQGVKFDTADDRAVRVQVIGKVFPSVKCDGQSDDYVRAMYDAAIAKHTTDAGSGIVRVDGVPGNGGQGNGTPTENTDGLTPEAREKKARQDMIDRGRGVRPISFGMSRENATKDN